MTKKKKYLLKVFVERESKHYEAVEKLMDKLYLFAVYYVVHSMCFSTSKHNYTTRFLLLRHTGIIIGAG